MMQYTSSKILEHKTFNPKIY